MKFCRYFDRFAASLVCCLSEARQGKLADKRPVKMTCINFLVWILYYFVFLMYTPHDYHFKLQLQFTSSNYPPPPAIPPYVDKSHHKLSIHPAFRFQQQPRLSTQQSYQRHPQFSFDVQ